MGFFQANIWKASFFKNIQSLFSSPKKAITCVLVSENGIASKISLALSIGFTFDPVAKMTWTVINKLRMPMEGTQELVLPISERSYVPLDPLNRLTTEEKTKLASLKDIAVAKRREARSRVSAESKTSINAEAIKTLMYIIGFIVIISLVVYFFKK
jgi:hypothetical protein